MIGCLLNFILMSNIGLRQERDGLFLFYVLQAI